MRGMKWWRSQLAICRDPPTQVTGSCRGDLCFDSRSGCLPASSPAHAHVHALQAVHDCGDLRSARSSAVDAAGRKQKSTVLE